MKCPLIVVTDLDGTLLDHHSYGYETALPALKKLDELGIPLILNSSKTAGEVQALRADLGNRAPYVVENGAGIHVPAGGDKGGEQTIGIGQGRDRILSHLHALRQRHDYRFTGFADLDVDQLVGLTGLEPEQAAQALAREFSEPLVWEDTEERFLTFCASLRDAGLSVTRGGRFVHVASGRNKGDALGWLRDHYRTAHGTPVVMALGDGENDVPMLEASDYPVVVASPVNAAPRVCHPAVRYMKEAGPTGWNRAVLERLDSLPT